VQQLISFGIPGGGGQQLVADSLTRARGGSISSCSTYCTAAAAICLCKVARIKPLGLGMGPVCVEEATCDGRNLGAPMWRRRGH